MNIQIDETLIIPLNKKLNTIEMEATEETEKDTADIYTNLIKYMTDISNEYTDKIDPTPVTTVSRQKGGSRLKLLGKIRKTKSRSKKN
jgi:hypothetical protein